MRDYFYDNLVYDDVQFCTRFRMSKRLILKKIEAIRTYNFSFVQKVDATGTLDLSNIQKYVVAIRMIEYGVPSDATEE